MVDTQHFVWHRGGIPSSQEINQIIFEMIETKKNRLHTHLKYVESFNVSTIYSLIETCFLSLRIVTSSVLELHNKFDLNHFLKV